MSTVQYDLIYFSLRLAIIASYHSGDLDNSLNQLEVSLCFLDKLYDPAFFHTMPLPVIEQEKINLLNKIQDEVNKVIGSCTFWELLNEPR